MSFFLRLLSPFSNNANPEDQNTALNNEQNDQNATQESETSVNNENDAQLANKGKLLGLQQELLDWIENGLGHTNPRRHIRNISRDFRDGVFMAELLYHFRPDIVELHNYSRCSSLSKSEENWRFLNVHVLTKIRLGLSCNEIKALARGDPATTKKLLARAKKVLASVDSNQGSAHDANPNDGAGAEASDVKSNSALDVASTLLEVNEVDSTNPQTSLVSVGAVEKGIVPISELAKNNNLEPPKVVVHSISNRTTLNDSKVYRFREASDAEIERFNQMLTERYNDDSK